MLNREMFYLSLKALSTIIFQPLEVMGRSSETQLQVDINLFFWNA